MFSVQTKADPNFWGTNKIQNCKHYVHIHWIHKFLHFFTKSFFLAVWSANNARNSLSWAFLQKI
jgi:hypothetical protein